MKFAFLTFALAIFFHGYSQNILPDANTIIVKNVGFNQVCNALLDSGYKIEKKDADLQTVRTEAKQYPKYWNATYTVDIRVKDSTAFITAKSHSTFGEMEISNNCNKKGESRPKSMITYPFLLLSSFATCFKQEVTYEKR